MPLSHWMKLSFRLVVCSAEPLSKTINLSDLFVMNTKLRFVAIKEFTQHASYVTVRRC